MKILLHAVSDTEQEGFVQRIAIYLLNSLACLVDGKQKLFLGDLGAISVRMHFDCNHDNGILKPNVFDIDI